MGARPTNPYFDLVAIEDPQRFFGRTHLLRRLYSALASKQSVSLVGSRRAGKSSILRCLHRPEMQARFEVNLSQHIFVFIDLHEHLLKTSKDFFDTVSKLILAQCHGRQDFVLQPQGGADAFSHLLESIKNHGFHTVLLMDCFHNIIRNEHFDADFLGFLRAQASMGKVSYVTASTAPLAKVCHQGIEGSPFFNIFSHYPLEPLTYEEACELITAPAHQTRLPFTVSEIEWILTQAGRHPFFIQRVCHVLFEEKSLRSTTEVDSKRISKQAYTELEPHFEDAWQSLNEQQRELLQDEAQRTEVDQRELPELSESALFRNFVRAKYRLPLFRMTIETIDEVLKNIDDAQFLAKSDLRHLSRVSMHLKRETIPTAIERGMAVRAVLNEAFERMQGPGVRRDSAPEWILYNILYYRYFKLHLQNEQISARLGFNSIRQYYRERTKAVDVLLQTLLSMEASIKNDD